MIRLLREPKRVGLPADWWFGRLRGRRTDWVQQPVTAQSRVLLAAERRYLYAGLPAGWRQRFAAVFVYFELPALLVALRQLGGGEGAALQQLASASLWPRQLLDELAAATDLPAAADRIECSWQTVLPGLDGLGRRCRRDGSRRFEEQMNDAFFAALAGQPLVPGVRAFFAELIDGRNLLALVRQLRWEQRGAWPLHPGGKIPVDVWEKLSARNDPAALARVVRHLTAASEETPTAVEQALRSRVSQHLQRQERRDPQNGLLLNTLWRSALLERSAGLRYWAGDAADAWEQVG